MSSADIPLYEQIAEQIRAQVFSGALRGGEQLPSIRVLAKELQVSIITTKRAYEDLERDGFVRTVSGKGTFVSSHPPAAVKQMQLEEVSAIIRKAARKAQTLGMDSEEFAALSSLIYKEEA